MCHSNFRGKLSFKWFSFDFSIALCWCYQLFRYVAYVSAKNSREHEFDVLSGLEFSVFICDVDLSVYVLCRVGT